jgi:tetratricopeptide (TPR) repeat protein
MPVKGEGSMEAATFYQKLLNLAAPWYVKDVVVEEDAPRVSVYLDHTEAALFACPVCARSIPVCEHTEEKTWRHLDTCQKQTHLLAKLPVVTCPEHGKQTIATPLGGVDAPVSFAFAQMLNRLVRDLGNWKKPAVITRISESLLRGILRRPEEPSASSENSGEGNSTDARGASAPGRSRQLSLFSQNDMILVNQGLQALKALQLESAIELFRKHQKIYPKGQDVVPRLALAEFLLQGLREAPADIQERIPYLCRFWNEVEDYAHTHCVRSNDRLTPELQKAFFEKALQEIQQAGLIDAALIGGQIPVGYIFLRAGQDEQAVAHLQAAIPEAPHSAALYGYLGDAHALRGKVKTARQCYREGCLIDPAAIDWEHLQDEELKDLREDLLVGYGFEVELATAWLPSHARVAGLFERKVVRLHDGMKELVDDYVSLEKSLRKEANPINLAMLFFRGIILCENEESLKLIKKVDPIEVRRLMKKANPDLFAEFLTSVVAAPVRARPS